MNIPNLRRTIAALTAFALMFAQVAQAANVTLATEPLANITTSVVLPNIMYVLDDSGSMAWDYTPDYVNDSESPTQQTWGMCWGTTGMTKACPMSGGGGLPRDTNNSTCCNAAADANMPWYTSEVNYQYYDPAVRYTPPVRADGSSYPNSPPTTAKSDGYSGTSTTDLTTKWPHQVWCTSSTATPTAGDPTAGGKCLQNLDTTGSTTLLPDATHVYPKTYPGGPTYFTMDPSEYCSDDNLTTCVYASDSSANRNIYNKPSNYRWCGCYWPAAVTPATATYASGKGTITTASSHGLTSGQSVTLTGFTPNAWNGAYTATVVSTTQFTIPLSANPGAVTTMGKVTPPAVGATAICPTNPGTRPNFSNCQGQRDPTHFIPNYLGAWNPNGSPPAYAYADVTINSLTGSQSITGVTIGGVQILGLDGSGNILAGHGNTTTNPPDPCAGNISTCNPNAPADNSTDIYSAIAGNTSFQFDQGLASYTTAPFDASTPYKYESYVGSSIASTDDVATALCQAINANTLNSGFSCPFTVLAANNAGLAQLRIQAANVGSAPNGRVVVVTGPAPTAATYPTVTFTVTTATSGFKATALNLSGAATGNLLGSTVTADGNPNTTAQLLCNAINSGPLNSTYDALSGGSSTYGTCSAGDATVTVRYKGNNPTFEAMTATLTLVGPASATTYTSTITVSDPPANPLGGTNWSRIDDITMAGTSILTAGQKATLAWDGSKTSTQIATDVASAITTSALNGCSATSSTNVVTITGTTCSSTPVIVTTSSAAQASATFAVSTTGQSANVPATLGTGTTLGSVTVSGTKIATNLTITDITNGTATQTNANLIGSKINLLTTTTHLAAASAVASGSNWNVTVSTDNNSSTYNGASFVFQHGTSSSGSGSAPQWNFDITNATTASKKITSITCGGTDTITTSTATTGAPSQSNADRVYNLAANSATNGLNAIGGINSYSWTCVPGTSPAYSCTLQGPLAAAACNGLSTSKGTGISITTSRTSAGATNTYTYSITNATTDNKYLASVTCGGTDTITTNAANTGSTSTNYAATLAADIQAQQLTGGGTGGWSTIYGTCTASGTTVNCSLARPADFFGGMRCSGGSVTITPGSGFVAGNIGAVTEHHDSSIGGSTRYYYTFAISNASSANQVISKVACSGASSDTAATNATTGSAPSANQLTANRINNLIGSMSNANGFSTSCTSSSAGSLTSTCTLTAPSAYGNCTPVVTSPDATITMTSPVHTVTASRPTWSYSIDNATTDSQTINSITCNGTNTFNTATRPTTSTAASSPYLYINNLTQTAGTGLNNIGKNSYSYSCTAATSASQSSHCVVTGPVGARACDNLTITPVSSSGITFSSLTPSYDTAHPGGSSSSYTDFYGAVASVGPFSNAYMVQSMSPGAVSSSATGPITISAASFTAGSSGSINAIPTSATGNAVALAGGSDAASANSWQNTGIFKRTDIVSTVSAYPKGGNRSDCITLSNACSYTEELQNFANWYTYYRTRMLMMKTASTLAFQPLGDKYRVGFDNICNATGNTVKLPVAVFDDSNATTPQKSTWWTQLISSTPTCATPLRAETAKIGQYYAHKLGTVADPIQYSCQQNFMFLVTDGYWNEPDTTSIKKVNGSDIGNTDNVHTDASGNIVTAYPYYDGQQASTTCPTIGSTRSSASSCRTLADVTYHYYSTDLRNSTLGNATGALGTDVSADNVPISTTDKNTSQHMVFYAMGLGINGTLGFQANYDTAGTGDYAQIALGNKNWPAVKNLDPTGVDDLWHAAVNGHGKYFSARNAPAAVAGLTTALAKIGERVGAASAAATSNLEPVQGDNYAYVASYLTVEWVGDLQARTIDLTSGAVSQTALWSAQSLLDANTWSARNICIAPSSGSSGSPLRAFTYANLSGTEQGYFDPGGSSPLSQYAGLIGTNASDITATNLVSYLSGDRSLEQNGSSTQPQIWRLRSHILGDIVDTQPVYVKKPTFSYAEASNPGYSDFKNTSAASSRTPVVFISANDGMLHAFNAHTANVSIPGNANSNSICRTAGNSGSSTVTIPPGGELWAFIPSATMPVMKTLADQNYTHRYFIDGLISVGDVDFDTDAASPTGTPDWHTILVAGMGGGGSSYIALDITDPFNPTYLWEFSDANMGKTFGNASINKLPSGEWAVFFSSGYNNSDGIGRLYGVNAQTGAILSGFPMSTGSGSAGSPSNLGKINTWATDPASDNTAQYIYGGDLNGDLWRFDLAPSASGHSGQSVFKLAHLADGTSSHNPQPITTKPEMTRLNSGTYVVYVGTGQYLSQNDLSSTNVQTFYAIKDTLGMANLPGQSTTAQSTWNPATDTVTIGSNAPAPMFLQRKLLSDSTNSRIICSGANATLNTSTSPASCANESGPAMDWSIYGGWYVPLPDAGERVNVDPNLSLGTLTFASNVPASNACTSGGYAWLNYIDYQTGLAVQNTVPQVSTKVGNSLIVGITVIKLPGGSLSAVATTSDNQQMNLAPSFSPTTFQGRRNLWREFEVY